MGVEKREQRHVLRRAAEEEIKGKRPCFQKTEKDLETMYE